MNLEFPNHPVIPKAPLILTKGGSCCHTPNESVSAEQQHRWHHWLERFKCAGFCMSVHIIYEVIHAYWW